MKDTIYESETGLTFELNGDYYVLAGEDEPEEAPIGTWGQRHLSYLKKHRTGAYREMLWNGTLNSYLADIDLRATEMYMLLLISLNRHVIHRCIQYHVHQCILMLIRIRNLLFLQHLRVLRSESLLLSNTHS